jgi:hypothetical protein
MAYKFQQAAGGAFPLGIFVDPTNGRLVGTINPSNPLGQHTFAIRISDPDNPEITPAVRQFTMTVVNAAETPSGAKAFRWITPADLGVFRRGDEVDIGLEVEVVDVVPELDEPPPPPGGLPS